VKYVRHVHTFVCDVIYVFVFLCVCVYVCMCGCKRHTSKLEQSNSQTKQSAREYEKLFRKSVLTTQWE